MNKQEALRKLEAQALKQLEQSSPNRATRRRMIAQARAAQRRHDRKEARHA